jgi:hypothetical protein
MNGQWTMTVILFGDTFPLLQGVAKNIFDQVAKAESYKEMPVMGSGGGGPGTNAGYSVEYSCPVEHRIKELRREADELEASVKAGFYE